MDELYHEKRMKMQNLTHKYVNQLTHIWTRIFDEDNCIENLDKLVEHAKNFYEELVTESMEKEEYVKKEIDELKKEAQNLKRLLHVDIALSPAQDAPLLVVQAELDNSLAELRECLRQRREQIYELLLEQESLCEELGEAPRQLLADPLPTPTELEDFRKHLEELKELRVDRLNKVSSMRRDIKQFLNILELQVTTETEDRLLNHRQIKLNKDTFNGLKRLHDSYGNQVQEVREKIDDMKNKLQTLWDRLDTSPNTRQKFQKYNDYTQHTFDVYYGELNRCQALKSQNIKLYVKQIRDEIVQWWDKTLKSQLQRNRFSNFNSNCYTDDLLVLHEMELEDLKTFYEQNHEIFELYANRKILWERMCALEAKASEPGRYNNRGGQLLKEEKERKIIATKLPKIEQQIATLCSAYEEREQKAFLVNGENIIDVMASEWEHKRQDKEKLSSARKQAQTPLSKSQMGSTTSRTPMSGMRNVSSAASMRKTPLSTTQSALALKRKFNHNEKQTPLAKRSLVYGAVNSPSVFLKPSAMATGSGVSGGTNARTTFKSPGQKTRVIGTTIRRRSGRLSSNAKKRRSIPKASPRARPRLVVTQPSTDHDDTYDSFEKCIEPASRSSIKPNSFNSTASNGRSKRMRLASAENQLPVPHFKTPPRMPPQSPGSSSSSSRKLTTKNLPIFF